MEAHEYRCPTCQALLVIGSFTGWVEVFCKRCKKRRRVDA
jgi:phage FluMu protein Com